MSTLEALLRRERAVVAVGLAALTVLAWIYLWRGAGMGMPALEMTRLALFPHTQPGPAMPMPNASSWALVLAMWWVMMIAMMMPGAAPLVLLYGRVRRNAGRGSRSGAAYAAPAFLAVGYLSAWLAFSLAATALQIALQDADLISSMLLSSRSAGLSAAVLIATGIYQFSPLKQVCLRHCRGPVQFLVRHWQPGRIGAFGMGLRHGAWCVGCCGMLMALLFVGGVMNLVWIAILALIVLAEKAFPGGVAVSRLAGAILVAWGIATLAV